ncbi:MAG: Asp-tRNA(Asn)/Glu-tRNA(Gln) amidotransferase subunit GatC [Chloroflexi bacterium]|nr:Asp-tRNA(Asn)/Glu-tRNA(Gln) amidotransferase subunit GatC [Chloroflexota bacterium]
MALTREQVKHVAELAKLGLTDEEIEMYCEQLSAILDYFVTLQRLDTDAIPPTATVLPLRNVMRTDEPGSSLSREDALANAPAAVEGYFQVKAILE